MKQMYDTEKAYSEEKTVGRQSESDERNSLQTWSV